MEDLQQCEAVANGCDVRLDELLELASQIDMYGRMGELEHLVWTASFEEALTLVRQLRLDDNVAIPAYCRTSFSLRRNEFLLLQLEARIAELIMFMELSDIR